MFEIKLVAYAIESKAINTTHTYSCIPIFMTPEKKYYLQDINPKTNLIEKFSIIEINIKDLFEIHCQIEDEEYKIYFLSLHQQRLVAQNQKMIWVLIHKHFMIIGTVTELQESGRLPKKHEIQKNQIPNFQRHHLVR